MFQGIAPLVSYHFWFETAPFADNCSGGLRPSMGQQNGAHRAPLQCNFKLKLVSVLPISWLGADSFARWDAQPPHKTTAPKIKPAAAT